MKYLLPRSKNGERSEDKEGGREKNDMIICDKNMHSRTHRCHSDRRQVGETNNSDKKALKKKTALVFV